MASLFSQNIGLNYKGIINLGSTINSPLSGTLQAITDGDGVASPLQLSTTQVAVGRASRIGQGLGWGDPLSGNFATLFLYDNSDGYTKINNQGFGINLQTAGVTRWTVTPAGDFAGGTTSASARLHVRGDGTNPIARFENGAGTNYIRVNSLGTQLQWNNSDFYIETLSGNTNIINTANNTFIIQTGTSTFATSISMLRTISSISYGQYFLSRDFFNTTGTSASFGYKGLFGAGAGSGNWAFKRHEYEINNSGAQTGTATGIFLNATETALNGMGHNLIDLQVGGVSQFRISKTDSTIYATNYNISASVYLGQAIAVSSSGGVKVGDSRVRSDGDGNLTLLNDAANSFGLLKLGGTTNAFPAIKRNGAAIDFRLADDSAPCNIRAGRLDLTGALLTGFINDTTNAITAISIASTTGKTTFFAPLAATALPTTRPATVGDLYIDTAANILANGDKVVGIRV